jgi:hypothetical protein
MTGPKTLNDNLRGQHIGGQIRLLFDHLKSKLWPLGNLVANHLLHLDEFPLFQVRNDL